MKIQNKSDIQREPEIIFIKHLTAFIVVLYIVSAVYDLTVTLTVYNLAPKVFLNYEANKIFLNTIKEGRPFYLSPTIWLDMLIPLIYIFSYELFDLKKTKFTFFLFFGITCGIVMLSIMHFQGGSSWLR